MKRILLDTNAYVRYLHGDASVLETIANAESVYLSVFVLGELFAGFSGGTKGAKNRKMLDSFLKKSTVKILSATIDTAERFGAVKEALRRKGTPIPINDVWIAAHAMESGSMLVTCDSHFKAIEGLLMWSGQE